MTKNENRNATLIQRVALKVKKKYEKIIKHGKPVARINQLPFDKLRTNIDGGEILSVVGAAYPTMRKKR